MSLAPQAAKPSKEVLHTVKEMAPPSPISSSDNEQRKGRHARKRNVARETVSLIISIVHDEAVCAVSLMISILHDEAVRKVSLMINILHIYATCTVSPMINIPHDEAVVHRLRYIYGV